MDNNINTNCNKVDAVRDNQFRLSLWDDNAKAHTFLCHGDGSACEDGCEVSADADALAFYDAEMVVVTW